MEKFKAMAGSSWCQCDQGSSSKLLTCFCGEQEDAKIEWGWDEGKNQKTVVVVQNKREVLFHPMTSGGTAAVAGDQVLTVGCHHYWEVRMLTKVDGTDIMVGVGTQKVDLTSASDEFSSLLGKCEDSWGYSYTGFVHHGGKKWKYGPRWGRGAILGVHLDSWRGTTEFYLNRKPLGIAFRGLKNKEMYPMLSSTFAQTGMRLICAQSFPSSLQFSCLKQLAHSASTKTNKPPALHDLELPPGLRSIVHNNFWFLVGQQVEDDVDYIDTPPVPAEMRLPARVRPTNDSASHIKRGKYRFVQDKGVATITELNAQNKTGSKKRKGVSLAENQCDYSSQDSDDEECFLFVQGGNSKKTPKLCNRNHNSLESVTRKNDGREKIEKLLCDKAKVKDSDALHRKDNETNEKKVIKKRFTLKRQK